MKNPKITSCNKGDGNWKCYNVRIEIYFTTQAGTQTSASQTLHNGGGGSGRGDRKQGMKKFPCQEIKDDYCLSSKGKEAYWNIGQSREDAVGIFLLK